MRSLRKKGETSFGAILTVGGLVGVLLMVVLGMTNGCYRGYSEGTRAGTIIKFSHKGLFVKSYEGEVVLGGMSTNSSGQMITNTWNFTVIDDSLVAKIEEAHSKGLRVKLHYIQWAFHPLSMESAYEIVDVEILED